jgi:hypothetical protein
VVAILITLSTLSSTSPAATTRSRAWHIIISGSSISGPLAHTWAYYGNVQRQRICADPIELRP